MEELQSSRETHFFSSSIELEDFLHSYQQRTNTTFIIVESKTIKKANKTAKFKSRIPKNWNTGELYRPNENHAFSIVRFCYISPLAINISKVTCNLWVRQQFKYIAIYRKRWKPGGVHIHLPCSSAMSRLYIIHPPYLLYTYYTAWIIQICSICSTSLFYVRRTGKGIGDVQSTLKLGCDACITVSADKKLGV
jgi:hypothetical protein